MIDLEKLSKNKLLDLIDFEKVNILLEGFNKTTGFVTAILDLEGNVLSKSGWRQICTEFHRVHPATSKKCVISDTQLSAKLAEGEKYHYYKCLNGLVDVAVPIVVNGEHIANLFSGQFFFEKPDKEFFKKQGGKYNFDNTIYLDALDKVPIIPEEKVKIAMDFLLDMTELIVEMTLQKLEQVEHTKTLKNSEERFRTIINQAGDAMYLCNLEGEIKIANNHSCEMLGYSRDEFLKMKIGDLDVNYIDPSLQKELWNKLTLEKSQTLLTTHKHKDGLFIPVEIRYSLINYDGYKAILGFVRDITERKQAEKAINLSNKRYKALFNDSPIPLWEEDFTELESHLLELKEKGHKNLSNYFDNNPDELAKCAGMIKILDVNQATLDLHKAKSKEQLIGNLSEIFTENSFNVFKNELLAVFEGKELFESESEVKTLQGDLRHIYLTLKIDQSQPGKVKALLATSDITERKLAEEKLKESEKKLLEISDNLEAHLWTFNGTEYTYFNKNWYDYTGQEKNNNVTIESWTSTVHPDDIEKSGKIWLENFENKAEHDNFFRLRRFDGIYRDYHCHAIPIFDKNQKFKHFLGFNIDITDRKKAEEAQQESEEKFRSVLENIHLIGLMIDNEANIVFANDYLLNLTGWKRDEIIGKNWFEYFIPKEINQEIKKVFKQTIVEDNVATSYENVIVTKSGQKRLIKWSNTAHYNEQNDIVIMTSIGEDITDRKKSEQNTIDTKQFYEEIIEGVQDGIWVTDENDIIYFANKGMEEIAGIPREKIQGNNLLKDFPEETTGELIAFYKQAKEEKKPQFYNIKVKTPTGKDTWQNGWLIPKYQNNKFTGIICTIRDVTEKIKIEEVQKETSERLSFALDAANEGFWEWNLSTNTITFDELGLKMLGYEPDFIIDTQLWLDKIHPDYKNNTLQAFDEYLSGKKSVYNVEFPMQKKDGTYFWVASTAKVFKFDSNEEPLLVIGIHQDITERKLAEEALKESEAKYRSLIDDVLDTSSVGIFILDSELKVAWINKATEKYFGIKRENVIGKDKKQLINSEIKEIFEDPEYFTKKVFNTYTNNNYIENFECHVISGKDREDRWLSHWSQPINKGLYKNGRIEQYTDITDRKNAEEKIRAAEDNLQNTFDLSPSIIAKANLDTGYFIEVNQAVSKTLGYTVDEFISTPFMELIHPDDRHEAVDEVSEQLTGKEVTFFENRYLCKDGTYKWMAWHGTKPDANGIATAIGSDIHERKIAEQELAKHRENLEDLVKERTKELETKNRELERFNDLFVDREFRIKELKEEIKKLK